MNMWEDPIVEEVRKVREEHAARFGHDLRAIFDDLKAMERQSGREVVSLPPKRPRKEETASVVR
jgi:hypothetical protein